MNIMTDRKTTAAEDALVERFDGVASSLPGANVDWVRKMRETAMAQFKALGLPDRRVEQWKYSDLRAKMREAHETRVESDAISESDIYDVLGVDLDEMLSYRLVVADGVFDKELSNIDGAEGKFEVTSLAETLNDPPAWFEEKFGKVNPQKNEAVLALNTAFMSDGVVIRVADGAELDRPVHLIMVTGSTKPGLVTTRNFVHVGEGAKLTLMESFSARRTPDMQRNCVTEMVVGDNAVVEHVKYQNEGRMAIHVASWLTELGQGADYNAFEFAIGGAMARHQNFLRFNGEHASAALSGAMMLWDNQHVDATTVVNHDAPNCQSRELFKCVLDDKSRGVVQGKVIVAKEAQKTDGHQMARSLMLSETAEFDSKPELEIYADDVLCGHGTTSGELDENLLFYLMARGIPEKKATALLVNAFIDEAIENVRNETIREAFLLRSADWLGEARG